MIASPERSVCRHRLVGEDLKHAGVCLRRWSVSGLELRQQAV